MTPAATTAVDLAHWVRVLDGAPNVLQVPADRPRPRVVDHERRLVEVTLPRDLARSVTAVARDAGRDPALVVLTGWLALLARATGEHDIVVGCRGLATDATADGVLVVRADVTSGATFRSLLERAAADVRAGAAAGAFSVPALLAALGAEPARNRHPFFQVAFARHDGSLAEAGAEPVAGAAPCDLVLGRAMRDEQVQLQLEHSPSLFDLAGAQDLLDRLVVLLRSALEEPERPVAELDVLTEQDRAQLCRWNDTAQPHDASRSIAALFAEQVRSSPDAVALEGDEQVLTYTQLDRRSDAVAHELRARGVTADVTVAISMDRSIELVTAVLGVLKAGGAYVPIDPTYPTARRSHMLEASGARLLLVASRAAADAAGPTPVEVLPVEEVGASDGDLPVLEPSTTTGEHLGYVIFTSGSTGLPKAVALPQAALTNLVEWQRRRPGFAPRARTLQFSSLSFDVSFQELFTTWCTGGTLVLVPDAIRRDPRGLLDHVVRHAVERIFLPFVALRGLADAAVSSDTFPSCLREVYTAGEQLQVDDTIRSFFSALPGTTLENQYGPSESHVVTAHRLDQDPATWPALPSIGGPIANTQLHVLNDAGVPCPPGSPGELHIGGVCLARGYLGDPEQTAERFVSHPLAGEGGRLYRTGDLARWAGDGTIDFLGRADNQVKFRGFRIEPGEVGAVLSSFPGVRQCVATLAEVDGGARLAAYVVPAAGAHVALADLHRFAREQLPGYMVPSHVTLLDAFPLTPSGKVDVQALPVPAFDRAILSSGYVPPSTATEEALASLWSGLLGVDDIGVEDDFFELGGDSLMAVELFALIKDRFGRELPLGALAQAPTVSGLAALLGSETDSAWSPLVPLRPTGSAPPLFCIHGGSGNVASFPNLARALPEHVPVYALQWDGLDGSRGSRTIEAMARTYLAAALDVQPTGPYRIAGQCIGGLIGREMARALQARGEEVELLVMYDSPNLDSPHYVLRAGAERIPHRLRGVTNRAIGLASFALGVLKGSRPRRDVLATRLRSALRRRIPQEDRELYGSLVMTTATWRHRIRPLDVPTLYIHTGRANARDIALTGRWTDGLLGWSDHLSGRFRAHQVVADHNAMPYQPHSIELVAEALGSGQAGGGAAETSQSSR